MQRRYSNTVKYRVAYSILVLILLALETIAPTVQALSSTQTINNPITTSIEPVNNTKSKHTINKPVTTSLSTPTPVRVKSNVQKPISITLVNVEKKNVKSTVQQPITFGLTIPTVNTEKPIINQPITFGIDAYKKLPITYRITPAHIFQGETGVATVTIINASELVTVTIGQPPPGVTVNPTQATLSKGASQSFEVHVDSSVTPGYYDIPVTLKTTNDTETGYIRLAVLTKNWLEGWGSRVISILDSYTQENETNYMVTYEIIRGTGESTGNTIYCDSCKEDFSDIRVTGPDGVTIIPYMIVPKDNNTAQLVVFVPKMPREPLGQVVYIYYSNPSAQKIITLPEIIKDDFNNSTVGELAGTAQLLNGIVQLTPLHTYIQGYVVYNKTPKGCVYSVVKFKTFGGTGADAIWIGLWDSDYSGTHEDVVKGGYHVTFDEWQNRIAFTKATRDNAAPIASYSTGTIDDGNWHLGEAVVCAEKNKVVASVYYDGKLVLYAEDDNPQSNAVDGKGLIVLGARSGGATNYHDVDYFYVYSLDNVSTTGYAKSTIIEEKGLTVNLAPNDMSIIPGSKSEATLTASDASGGNITVQPPSNTPFTITVTPNEGEGHITSTIVVESPTTVAPGDYSLPFQVSSTNGYRITVNLLVHVKGAWMKGWLKRVPIELYNKGTNGSTTVLRFIVHYGQGTNNPENIYCNGFCRPDFGDIRFTDSDGVTLLNYWIEKLSYKDYAIVWVKVNVNPGEEKTIYMYYDNYSALQPVLNPTSVFTFIDQCNGQWANIGSGAVKILEQKNIGFSDNTVCDKYTGTDPNGGGKYIGMNLTRGIVIDFYSKRVRVDYYYDRIGITDKNGNGYGFYYVPSYKRMGIDIRSNYNPTSKGSAQVPNMYGKWYRGVLIIAPNTVTVEMYDPYSGELLGEYTYQDTQYNKFNTLYLLGGYEYYVDSIKIYPYADIDISIGTAEGAFYNIPSYITVIRGNQTTVSLPITSIISGQPMAEQPTITASAPQDLTVQTVDHNITISTTDNTGLGFKLVEVKVTDGPITGHIPLRLIVEPKDWPQGWNYRKLIIIENPTSTEIDNYIDKFTIIREEGNDTSHTIYVGLKATENFSDILFTTIDGQTLGYWISSNILETANIWVKIGRVPPYPAVTPIYLYYGNPLATSKENPYNVFMFFDDFQNTTNWESNTGNYEIINNTIIEFWGNWNGGHYYFNTKENFTPPIQIIAKTRLSSLGDTDLYIGLTNTTTGYFEDGKSIWLVYDGESTNTYGEKRIETPAGTTTCGKVTNTQWHTLTITYTPDGSITYTDDLLGTCTAHYKISQPLHLSIGADTDYATRYGYIDWIAVKPVYNITPAISIGREESLLSKPKTLPVLIENTGDNNYAYPGGEVTVEINLNSTNFNDWSKLIPGSIYFTDEWGKPLYYYLGKIDALNKQATIYVMIPYLLPHGLFQVYMHYGGENPYYGNVLPIMGEAVENGWVKIENLNQWTKKPVESYTALYLEQVYNDHIHAETRWYGNKDYMTVTSISTSPMKLLASGITLYIKEHGVATTYKVAVKTSRGSEYDILIDTCYYVKPEVYVYRGEQLLESIELGCGDKTVAITNGNIPLLMGTQADIRVDGYITEVTILPVGGDEGNSDLYVYIHSAMTANSVHNIQVLTGVDHGYPDRVLPGWTYRYLAEVTIQSSTTNPVVEIPLTRNFLPYSTLPDGSDIRVMDVNGNTLPYKLENYNPESHTGELIVQLKGTYSPGDKAYILIFTGNKNAGPAEQADLGQPNVSGTIEGVTLVGPLAVPVYPVTTVPGAENVQFPVYLIQPSFINTSIKEVNISVSHDPIVVKPDFSTGWENINGLYALVNIPSDYNYNHAYWKIDAKLNGTQTETTGWMIGDLYLSSIYSTFQPIPSNLTYDSNITVTYINNGPSLSMGILDVVVNQSIANAKLAIVAEMPNLTVPISWGEGPVSLGGEYQVSQNGTLVYKGKLNTADMIEIDTTPSTYVVLFNSTGSPIAMAQADSDGKAVISSGELPVTVSYVKVAVYPNPSSEIKVIVPYYTIYEDGSYHILAMLPILKHGKGTVSLLVNPSTPSPRGLGVLAEKNEFYGITYSMVHGEPANKYGAVTLLNLVNNYYIATYKHSGYLSSLASLTNDGIGSTISRDYISTYTFILVPKESGSWDFAIDGEGTAILRIKEAGKQEPWHVVTAFYRRSSPNNKWSIFGTVNLTAGHEYLTQILYFQSGSVGTISIAVAVHPPSYSTWIPLNPLDTSSYLTVYALRMHAYTMYTFMNNLTSYLPSYKNEENGTTSMTIQVVNDNPYPVLDSVTRITVPDSISNQITNTTIRINGPAPVPSRVIYLGVQTLTPKHTYLFTGTGFKDEGQSAPSNTILISGFDKPVAIYGYDGEKFALIGISNSEQNNIVTITLPSETQMLLAVAEITMKEATLPYEVIESPSGIKEILVRIPYIPPGTSTLNLQVGNFNSLYNTSLFDYVSTAGNNEAAVYPTGSNTTNKLTGELTGTNILLGTHPTILTGPVMLTADIDGNWLKLSFNGYIGLYAPTTTHTVYIVNAKFNIGNTAYYHYSTYIYYGGEGIGDIWPGYESEIHVTLLPNGRVGEVYVPYNSIVPEGKYGKTYSYTTSYPVVFPYIRTSGDGVKIDSIKVTRWSYNVTGTILVDKAPLMYKSIQEILFQQLSTVIVNNPSNHPVYDVPVQFKINGIVDTTKLRPDGSNIRIEAPAIVPEGSMVPIQGALKPGHVYNITSAGKAVDTGDTTESNMVKIYTTPYALVYAQIGDKLKLVGSDYDGDGVIEFELRGEVPSHSVQAIYIVKGEKVDYTGIPYILLMDDQSNVYVIARIPYIPPTSSLKLKILYGGNTELDPDLYGPNKVYYATITPGDIVRGSIVTTCHTGYMTVTSSYAKITVEPSNNEYVTIINPVPYLDGLAEFGQLAVSEYINSTASMDQGSYAGIGYAYYGAIYAHHNGEYVYLYYSGTQGITIGLWHKNSFTNQLTTAGDVISPYKVLTAVFDPYTGLVRGLIDGVEEAHYTTTLPSYITLYSAFGYNDRKEDWYLYWIGISTVPDKQPIIMPPAPRDNLINANPSEWDIVDNVTVYNPGEPLYDYQLKVEVKPGLNMNVTLDPENGYAHFSFIGTYPVANGSTLVLTPVNGLQPGLVYEYDNNTGSLKIIGTCSSDLIRIKDIGSTGIIARIYSGGTVLAEGRDYDHDGYIEIPSTASLTGVLAISTGEYRQVYLPYTSTITSYGSYMFYVRVPYIPPGVSVPVKIVYSDSMKPVDTYYGGDKVFLFYKDFGDGDLSGWYVIGNKYGTWSITESTTEGKVLKGYDYSSSGRTALVYPHPITRPFIAVTVARPGYDNTPTVYPFAWTAVTSDGSISTAYWGGVYYNRWGYYIGSARPYGNYVPSSNLLRNFYHKITVEWDPANGIHRVYVDGVYEGEAPDQAANGKEVSYFQDIGFSTTVGGEETVFIKKVYVMAYAYPEPMAVIGNGPIRLNITHYKPATTELTAPNTLPIDIKSNGEIEPLYGFVAKVSLDNSLVPVSITSDPAKVRFIADYVVPTKIEDVVPIPLNPGTGGEYYVENGKLVLEGGFKGIFIHGISSDEAIIIAIPGYKGSLLGLRRVFTAYDTDGDGNIVIPPLDYSLYKAPYMGYLVLAKVTYTKVLLPYVLTYNDTDHAVYMVRIPQVMPNSVTRIYLYYGKDFGLDDSIYGPEHVYDRDLIFLSTYHNPANTHPSSVSAMDSLFNQLTSDKRIGGGFVNSIAHPYDPYGDDDYYASLYYFVFVPRSTTYYYIYTDSDDASDVTFYKGDFYQKEFTASWYGGHGVRSLPGYGGSHQFTEGQVYPVMYRQEERYGEQASHLAIGISSTKWASAMYDIYERYAGNWYDIYTSVYTTQPPLVFPGGVTNLGGITWYVVQWTGNDELKPFFWFKNNKTVSIRVNDADPVTYGAGEHCIPLINGHITLSYYNATEDKWITIIQGTAQYLNATANITITDVYYNKTFIGYVNIGGYPYIIKKAEVDPTKPYANITTISLTNIRIIPTASITDVAVLVTTPLNKTASIVAPVIYYEYKNKPTIILASSTVFEGFNFDIQNMIITFQGVKDVYGYIDVANLGLNPDTTYVFLYDNGQVVNAVPLEQVWDPTTLWIQVSNTGGGG